MNLGLTFDFDYFNLRTSFDYNFFSNLFDSLVVDDALDLIDNLLDLFSTNLNFCRNLDSLLDFKIFVDGSGI